MILTTVLAYMGSFFATIAVVPQIIKVIRIKEANAFSYSFLFLRLIGFFCFCMAMVSTKHYWVASSYVIVIAINGSLVVLKFYYSKNQQ